MVITGPSSDESVKQLDETDQKLLELLQADARRSARALARLIGMSPGAVSERVARLERSGVIKGYHAKIDPIALGLNVQVFIGLKIEQAPSLSDIIDSLVAIPEVAAVHVVSGQWDLVLIAQVRDGEHLREVILEKLWPCAGFRHSETMLILGTYENENSVPVSQIPPVANRTRPPTAKATASKKAQPFRAKAAG
jgi:DNA-binding Lrp family transcriptional regulator